MYYKIINKECEVYKRLYKMRSEELQFEKDNEASIREKTGLEWETFLGHRGQQNFGRVTSYSGFKFLNSEKVDLKIWKKHPEHEGVFTPNTRTKVGKEMNEFLLNGLKSHWYGVVYDNLGLENPLGRFTIPFVEIGKDDIIIMYLDDKIKFNNSDEEFIIEITSKEFESLR